MKNVLVQKKKLPLGDYIHCDQCGEYWSVYVVFQLFGHEYCMCMDCFEDYKREINKI